MKNLYLNAAISAMKGEADAILKASEKLGSDFQKVVEIILNHKGKLMICGVGKSGLIGQKIAATLSSTGTPAVFMHACDAVHGDLGVYEAGDPTILISKSGSTIECLRVIPTLKKFNSKIIALIGNLDSPMAKEADVVLDASVTTEVDPLGIVPTSSSTLALAIGDALACALIKARGFTKEDFAKLHPAGQLGRNLTLVVSDVMHKIQDCAIANPHDSIRNVVISMTEKPLGASCIVDSNGLLQGLITDGDLRRMLKNRIDLDSAKCSDIMTKSPIYTTPDSSLLEAIKLMEERPSAKRLSVLPVKDSNGLAIGLIRLHDIYQG